MPRRTRCQVTQKPSTLPAINDQPSTSSLLRHGRPRDAVAGAGFAGEDHDDFDEVPGGDDQGEVANDGAPPAAAFAARGEEAQAEELLAEGAAAVAVADQHADHEDADGDGPDDGDGLHRSAHPRQGVADEGRREHQDERQRERVHEESGHPQEGGLRRIEQPHETLSAKSRTIRGGRSRMNSRKAHLYSPLIALLAVLLLGGCVAGERRTTHIARTWDATAIKRIELREVDGEIHVEAGTAATVGLEASIRSWGKRPDFKKENQGYFETRVEGDTLVIGRREHRHFSFFDRDRVSIDYDLKVPAQLALEVRTVNGRVVTRGVNGGTDITTVNGSIDIETSGANELVAHTVNGRIETKFENDFQGASLKTVNGRVTAILPSSASFVGDFTQVNGDFEAAFPLNIHSHPGSRRVTGEVNGGQHELKITTVNGDIKVDNGGVPVPPSAPRAPATPGTPLQPSAPPAPPAPPAPVS